MDGEVARKWQKKLTNVQAYHDEGYTGKGITVLCHEDTEHGRYAMKVLKAIAPGVDVIYASVGQKISKGKLVKYDWTIEGRTYSFDEVMDKFKPDIISCSLKSPNSCIEREEIIQPYIDNGQLIVCTAAGNEGGKGAFPMYNNALVIGACQFYYNDENDIRIAPYSGRTEGEEKISYVGFMWDWSGTSAATPFVAGQIALFLERYGKISQSELQNMLKPYCRDLGDVGKDYIYGDGLIVLPDDLDMNKREDDFMFKDVEPNRWSADAIEWANENGIIKGMDDGTFAPEMPLTREQACVILKRFDDYILKNK